MVETKEIRVSLYATENDSYVELWKVHGEKNAFIGRFVYGMPTWVYVSDPLGYCEMDYDIHPDVEVIVCTPDGKDLFATRNGDGSAAFATMGATAKREFNAYREKHPEIIVNTQEGYARFKHWLLSYKDPERYGNAAKDYDDNWMYSDTKETKRVTLKEWDYLGFECALEAVSYRHAVCGKTWTVIMDSSHIHGYIFNDTKMGTMYSEGEAEKMVEDAIRSHFGRARAVSIVVHVCGDQYAQRNIRMYEAVQSLLKGNYRRSFVEQIAQAEREETHFFNEGMSGIGEIRVLHPVCSCDYSFFI